MSIWSSSTTNISTVTGLKSTIIIIMKKLDFPNTLLKRLWHKLCIWFWLILQLSIEDVYMSYLPLAHIFDRVIEECFINSGASIGFWRGVRRFILFKSIKLSEMINL